MNKTLHQHHPPFQFGGWQLELAYQLRLDYYQQGAFGPGAVEAEHAEVGPLDAEANYRSADVDVLAVVGCCLGRCQVRRCRRRCEGEGCYCQQ